MFSLSGHKCEPFNADVLLARCWIRRRADENKRIGDRRPISCSVQRLEVIVTPTSGDFHRSLGRRLSSPARETIDDDIIYLHCGYPCLQHWNPFNSGSNLTFAVVIFQNIRPVVDLFIFLFILLKSNLFYTFQKSVIFRHIL